MELVNIAGLATDQAPWRVLRFWFPHSVTRSPMGAPLPARRCRHWPCPSTYLQSAPKLSGLANAVSSHAIRWFRNDFRKLTSSAYVANP